MKRARDHLATMAAAAGAAVGLALLLATGAATLRVVAPKAALAATARPVPRIDKTDCWFAIPSGRRARCGTLVLAERVEDPGSRPLGLRFVVFEGRGAAHATDPVIYISG